MGIDIVFDRELLGLAPPDIGFGFVVRDDQLDPAAVDAARFVDAVDRHLHADECRLADDGGGAGQRLHRADPVWLWLSEHHPPRHRRDTGPAERRGAPREHPAARDDAPGPTLVTGIARHLATL